MTTGTIVRDDRVTQVLGCGTARIGSFFSRTWNGADDPLHKRVNSYTVDITSMYDPVITWRFSSDPPGATRTGSYASCFGGIAAENFSFGDNDQITLVNRLGDQIRGHSFDAANSIGAEGKDALKQIAGAAGSLYRANKALNRGDLSAAAAELGIPSGPAKGRRKSELQKQNDRLGKNLSNSVLAVQLGALPLMSDIASAADALITVANRYPKKTYVSKSVARGICWAATDSGKTQCGTVRDSKRLVWTITAEPTGFEQFSMSNPWDLADLLWNYKALSFVVDWALPLQKFLSAKSTAYDFKGSGYETRKKVIEGRTQFAPPNHQILDGVEYRMRTVHLTRAIVLELQVPLPNFKALSELPSWQRALTAVSLLGQKIL